MRKLKRILCKYGLHKYELGYHFVRGGPFIIPQEQRWCKRCIHCGYIPNLYS